MPGTVTVCPECDSPQIYERQTKTPAWRCKDCAHEFAAPVERESRRQDSLSAGRPDLEDDTPTAADLDTPDAAFDDVGLGDRLDLDKADSDGYRQPLAVIEVLDRTVWDVPLGTDWVEADVILSRAGSATTRYCRAEIHADGTVDLYRPADDEPVREARKHIGRIETASDAGEVSQTAKLQLVGDGVDMPEGDDSWKRIGGESA